MKFAKEIFTILCDDIRQEIGNKVSLMGVYGTEVTVPSIPYFFPKLCLWVTAKDVQHEIHGIKVIVKTPKGDPVVIDLPEPPNQNKSQDMQIGVMIAPLKIDSEGKAMIEIFQKGGSKPFASHTINIKTAK